MSKLAHRLYHQFHQPRGAFGHVAGWLLAAKGDHAEPLLDAAKLGPKTMCWTSGAVPASQ